MPLPKLPVTGFDNENQRRRLPETINGILTHQFDDSRVQTSAEKLAGVTPVNYAYPPGNVLRYGAVGDNSSDCSAAFQAAINQFEQTGGEVVIPSGTYIVASDLVGCRGLKMTGDGRYLSVCRYTGTGNFLKFTGSNGNADSGSMVFQYFTVEGTSSAGNLFELEVGGGQSNFHDMRIRKTNQSCVVLSDNSHRVSFDNCLIESFATAGVYTNGLNVGAPPGPNSILTISNTQFNIRGSDGITQAATSAAVSLGDGELIELCNININGDDTLAYFIRCRGEVGRLAARVCYMERLIGPCVISDSDALISGMELIEGNYSCANSMSIDLSAGSKAHAGIFIRNIRRPETGAVKVFNPGSSADFDYAGVPLDGSADHVQGYAGYRAVRKYLDGRVDVNGNPSTAVTTLANYTFAFDAIFSAGVVGGVLTPAQITADQNDYNPTGFLTKTIIRLSTDASRTITGMARDARAHIKYLLNIGTQNVVLAHQSASSTSNQRFRLPGSASYTIAPNEGVMIVYDTVQDCWRVCDK